MVKILPKKSKRIGEGPRPAKEDNQGKPTLQADRNLEHISILSYGSASGDRAPGGILHTSKQFHPDFTVGWNAEVAGPMPVIDVSLSVMA